jgi:tRNA 2-thiouridine synthesizing protein D
LEKGYGVNLFLYIDGVHVPKKGQISLRFPNVEAKVKKLIDMGLKVKACVRCASARGYVEGPEDPQTCTFPTTQYVNGASITELYDFPRWIKESDRVLSFGG